MKTLLITKIKPNPAGKDRPRVGPLNAAQLAGEWVDITNTGSSAVPLKNIALNNRAYHSPTDTVGHWAWVMTFPDSYLPAGKTARVHAGERRDVAVIRPEDLIGADYHLFTGRDQYVWNNRQGDTAALWDTADQRWIDKASYDPNPPEGLVLARVGDKLQVYAPPAVRYR